MIRFLIVNLFLVLGFIMVVNRIDKAQNYAYTNNNIPDGEKFPQVGSWREISIANGGECNDREICRIDP